MTEDAGQSANIGAFRDAAFTDPSAIVIGEIGPLLKLGAEIFRFLEFQEVRPFLLALFRVLTVVDCQEPVEHQAVRGKQVVHGRFARMQHGRDFVLTHSVLLYQFVDVPSLFVRVPLPLSDDVEMREHDRNLSSVRILRRDARRDRLPTFVVWRLRVKEAIGGESSVTLFRFHLLAVRLHDDALQKSAVLLDVFRESLDVSEFEHDVIHRFALSAVHLLQEQGVLHSRVFLVVLNVFERDVLVHQAERSVVD